MASLNHIWQRTFPFKALIAIFWDLQPLWSSSLTKPNLLRFRCSSGHVHSKTKSVSSHFFYIYDIANSSSFNCRIFRKKSLLEKFRGNVLKSIVERRSSEYEAYTGVFGCKLYSRCISRQYTTRVLAQLSRFWSERRLSILKGSQTTVFWILCK